MRCEVRLKVFWQKYWIELTLAFIISVSFFLRIWQLGKIGEKIFDEVYFVQFAQNYLSKTEFFDIHPPLGKLIIALALKLFGDTSFTWRIMPAIFGTLLILVGYLIGKEISSKRMGLLVSLILALDGMLLVYSRTGLIDIFLSFFILLAFYFFLRFARTQEIPWLISAGVSMALAASVKYIGALILLIFILIIIVRKIPLLKNLGYYLVFLIILPAVIYLSFFLFNFHGNDFFAKVLEWHNQSFNYNFTLNDSHPYGSKWWGWFLLLRPIWLYFKDIDGKFIGIGNPLAWWSSLAIIPLLIWGISKGHKDNMIILGGFLIFLLIWAPVKRVLFFYHAMPSFLFLSLGTAFWLEKLSKIHGGKYFLGFYLGVLVILFIFFLPIWLGLPLESSHFYWRIWFKGWI